MVETLLVVLLSVLTVQQALIWLSLMFVGGCEVHCTDNENCHVIS